MAIASDYQPLPAGSSIDADGNIHIPGWVQGRYEIARLSPDGSKVEELGGFDSREPGTGGQLTPDQLAQVQALTSPVYLVSGSGLAGYSSLDDALAVAAGNADSALYFNQLYLSSNVSGAAIGGNTVFGSGLALDPSQPIDFSGARAFQYISSGETLVLTNSAEFHQSKLSLLTIDGQEVSLHDSGATDLAGTGTVYLYGSTPDPLTVAAGIVLVDRRGGAVGTPRDPYDVPAAKALQVIADYQAALGPIVETDTVYYGCVFTDDYTQPGDEFKYECSPSRPVNTGGATVWKWRRYSETGV